jgi:hypothetical protein
VFGVALALAAGGIAVAVCARARYRQRRLSPGDVAAIERIFRFGDDAKMRATLRSVFPDAADAAPEVASGDTDAARLAFATALDESLGDLDRQLSAHEGVGSAAMRVALLSAGLGAVVELSGDFSRVPIAMCAGMLGVGAAAACFELGRNATERATRLRGEWDRVADAVVARFGLPEAATFQGSSPRRGDRDQRRSRRRGS